MTELPDWLQAWLHTVTLWDLALWLAAAVAAVAFVKKGWPALKRFAARLSAFIRTVDAVVGLPEFIERTDRRIGEIHHETHKNDGSSIKDSSDRTELAVARVEEGVKGLYDRVAVIDESLAGVHGRLDELERRTGELADADDEIRQDAEQLRLELEDTHPRNPETNGDES